MTRRQVSDLFEDDDSTIDRYLAANEAELRHNGYVLMRGKSLKNIKLPFAPLISAGSKMTQLGLLDHQCGDELIQRIPVCCSPLLNHLCGDELDVETKKSMTTKALDCFLVQLHRIRHKVSSN